MQTYQATLAYRNNPLGETFTAYLEAKSQSHAVLRFSVAYPECNISNVMSQADVFDLDQYLITHLYGDYT